jgi:hypothetical protein
MSRVRVFRLVATIALATGIRAQTPPNLATGSSNFEPLRIWEIPALRYSPRDWSIVRLTNNTDSARLWSERRLAETVTSQNLDITPDGKSFAALTPIEEQEDQKAKSQVIFLENFADELQRNVPAGK